MSRFVVTNGVLFVRKNITGVELIKKRPGALPELRVYRVTQMSSVDNPEGIESMDVSYPDEGSCTRAYRKLASIVEENVEIL